MAPLIRFQGSLPLRVSRTGFGHLANFIQARGTMESQPLLLERALGSLDQAMVWGVLRSAEEDGPPRAWQKRRRAAGKSLPRACSHPAGVALQGDGGREALFSLRVGDRGPCRLCGKVGADRMLQE